MANERKTSLLEIYQSFLDEAELLESEIKENEFSIEETTDYLDQLYNKETDDFKVFSPRNVLNTQKKEIENNKAKIEKLQNTNSYLRERLKKIKIYLEALEDALDEKQEKKIKSNYSIIDVQVKERKRIAQDLHDTTLQNISYLIYKVELIKRYLEMDVSRAKVELTSMDENLRNMMEELRDIIYSIHPIHFYDVGFQKSVEDFFDKLKERYPDYTYDIEISPDKIENTTLQISIFRIIREACNNAVVHSKGNVLQVKFKKEVNDYYLFIKDNGVGFQGEAEHKSNHYGLSIMKERAQLLGGKLDIQSDERGTKITVRIPIS